MFDVNPNDFTMISDGGPSRRSMMTSTECNIRDDIANDIRARISVTRKDWEELKSKRVPRAFHGIVNRVETVVLTNLEDIATRIETGRRLV